MGSKTAKSTQAITIPPEVLARYNAINARADVVTNRPFQKYTGEFVAPLTETQRAIALDAWLQVPPMQNLPSTESLGFLGVNFWLYAWPVWPLAIVAIAHWAREKSAGSWRAPH